MKKEFLKVGFVMTLCVLSAGCAKETASEGVGKEDQSFELLAEAPVWGVEGTAIQDMDTKTIRTEDGATYWLNGNAISVFQGALSRSEFKTNIEVPSPVAVFEGSLSVVTGTSGNQGEPMDFWAVYPYSPEDACDGTSVTLSVKNNVTGTAGTFSNDDFPSVGTSRDLSIAFYNVCSGLALKVAEPGIVSVTVKGNNSEILAGKVRVSFAEGRPEVSEIISGKDSVVFNAPEEDGFIPGETYYIPLLPGTLDGGFELVYKKHVINDAGGFDVMQASYKGTETVNLDRSVFGRVYELDADAEYSKVDEIVSNPVENLAAVYDSFIINVASTAGIYNPMRALFNLCGDDIYSAGAFWGDMTPLGDLNEFYHTPQNEVVRTAFTRFYTFIGGATEFISRFKAGLPDGKGSDDLKRVVAEARVLRAYMHMMLAIGWGNVPVVHQELSTDEYPVQSTKEQVLDWCIAECSASLDYLAERESTQDKDGALKVTKGFANAVAGKAALFNGNYSVAKEYFEKVIDSDKYALVSGERYMDNFHIEGNGNEEKIFECNIEQFRDSDFGTLISHTTWMESNVFAWRSYSFMLDPVRPYSGPSISGWGGIGISQSVADEFIENDGPGSYRVRATIISIDELIYGTYYGMPEIDDMSVDEKRVSERLGIRSEGLYAQSLYLPLKIVAKEPEVIMSGCRINNYVIMRYAEVLLMYAEACLMTGDNATAKDVINQIQKRAGSNTVSEAVDMEVLKKEKKLEMWMEGCRWPDMVRWGDFEGVREAGKNVPVLYDEMFRVPSDGENVRWHEEGRFYTVETSGAYDNGKDAGFKSGKHELFPIPQEVIDANPNIQQNPGW